MYKEEKLSIFFKFYELYFYWIYWISLNKEWEQRYEKKKHINEQVGQS